jgi:dTDP-glucose 4,6-dehydratase
MENNSNLLLVTGGCGFIGSNYIADLIKTTKTSVVNIDSLTYAGNPRNLSSIQSSSQYKFVHGNINDVELIDSLLKEFKPTAILNFAAESHVDKSILNPDLFIETNVLGTLTLLKSAYSYWSKLQASEKELFRFVHISTDEVYGSLGPNDSPFTESNPYKPNSPYAASKASSDHLVRSYFHTYGLPSIITNCSNNYGPYQFPEKLIPLMILKALRGESLPVYGDGRQIRDWLYVGDHVNALNIILRKGVIGEVYNIGGCNEKKNIDVVKVITSILDELRPPPNKLSYFKQLKFIKDRPGHDERYAINPYKLINQLGWRPKESFDTGIKKTVQWYLDNSEWLDDVSSGKYQDWINIQYQ